jgi:hypothetical protein
MNLLKKNKRLKNGGKENTTLEIKNDIKKFKCNDIGHLKTEIIGVYGIQNKIKPDKWYVGRSKNIHKRWGDYKKLKFSKQWKLYRAIMKHGIENFVFHILEQRPNLIGLKGRENFWINKKDSVHNGYNCYGAGDSPSNVCKETLKKISNGMKNSEKFQTMMKSDEYRKKLSIAKMGNTATLGKKLSDEHKQKLSKSAIGNKYSLGKTWTEEHKKLQSQRMNGNTFSKGRTLTEEDKHNKSIAQLWRWAWIRTFKEMPI